METSLLKQQINQLVAKIITLEDENTKLKAQVKELWERLSAGECEQCKSNMTYISPNGYDTVLVCLSCNHEQSKPWPDNSDQ